MNDELDELELGGLPSCRSDVLGTWPTTPLRTEESKDCVPSPGISSSYRSLSSSLSPSESSRLENARPMRFSFSLGVPLSFFASFLLRPDPDKEETALDAQPATLSRLPVLPASPAPPLLRLRLALYAVPTEVVDPRELGRGVLASDGRRLTVNPTSASSVSSAAATEEGRCATAVFDVDEMEGVERPNANSWGGALRRGVSVCWIADL